MTNGEMMKAMFPNYSVKDYKKLDVVVFGFENHYSQYDRFWWHAKYQGGFIEGLMEFLKGHSYPVRYDTNRTEQGMTITGIEQAIKEYCGEVRITDAE